MKEFLPEVLARLLIRELLEGPTIAAEVSDKKRHKQIVGAHFNRRYRGRMEFSSRLSHFSSQGHSHYEQVDYSCDVDH